MVLETSFNELSIHPVIIFLIASAWGIIPAMIAYRKGRSYTLWWLLGTLFFLPVFIVALIMEPNDENKSRRAGMVKCPFCAEYIKKEAHVCRFCGRDIPPSAPKTHENLGSSKNQIRFSPPPKTKIHISTTPHARKETKQNTAGITQPPVPPPNNVSPETPVEHPTAIACPHCQTPIDISGLPAGVYECPNCHGNIALS